MLHIVTNLMYTRELFSRLFKNSQYTTLVPSGEYYDFIVTNDYQLLNYIIVMGHC